MDEMNNLPEDQNNEEIKEQATSTPETVEVNASAANIPAPKLPIPKPPLIIGSAIAGVAAIAITVGVILGGGGHKHSYGEWKTVDAPTCLIAGIEERVCECNEREMRRVDALGHTEVIDSAVDPTCSSKGLTEGKHCSECGAVILAQTTVSQLTHKYSSDTDIDCNYCGEIRETACQHTETETIPGKAATYTESGLTSGTKCTKCGKIIVAQQTISASGHKYNSGVIVSTATCSKSGTKKYTCTVSGCSYSYTETYNLPTYTATEISNQAIKYVGEITTYDRNGYALATGTGFVMSSDGKIITNYHVIEDAYSAKIIINNVSYTISSVLAYDANIDLAILKINATGLTAAKICKQPAKVGETVYAIGSSRGLTNTFSQGIVTYADRVVDGVSHVQHDASITHGNSGGPLINVYGEVIGINTWGIAESQNLNFAVASDELDNLVYLSTPITLAQLYQQNNSAFKTLVDFILANGEQDGNRVDLYIVDDADETTVFSYDLDDGTVDLTCYHITSSNGTFFTGISLRQNADDYFYASYRRVDGVLKNKILGRIKYESFTQNSLVGYDTYEGLSSQESLMRESASDYTIYLVKQLEWLATNYLDLTVADFGFTSFSDSQNNNGGNTGNNNYSQYQEELETLTNKYNEDVAELQDKIIDSQAKIETCQNVINNARSQLASLSPTCPQWFLQQYINNWQSYGSTGAATTAAQNAWAQEYNNQRNQLNNTISIHQTAISGHQTNISLYSAQIEVLTTQYNANVNALKAKYGIS